MTTKRDRALPYIGCMHSPRRACPDCAALERAQQWQAASLALIESHLVELRDLRAETMRAKGQGQ